MLPLASANTEPMGSPPSRRPRRASSSAARSKSRLSIEFGPPAPTKQGQSSAIAPRIVASLGYLLWISSLWSPCRRGGLGTPEVRRDRRDFIRRIAQLGQEAVDHHFGLDHMLGDTLLKSAKTGLAHQLRQRREAVKIGK